MNLTRLLAVAALTVAPALAQTPVTLIGLTRNPLLVQKQDMTSCAMRTCPAPFATASTVAFAGGTAFDATTSSVWLTQGTVLTARDEETCVVTCAPLPVPLPANALATGLAINESLRALWISDSADGITRMRLACPPTQQQRCVLQNIPATHTIGGIASSDLQGLLFIGISNFATPAAPGNSIVVTAQTNPCVPVCRFDIRVCGTTLLGPITGVAYDDCRRAIWITDGRQVVGATWNGLPVCSVSAFRCCQANANNPYVGLCINPSHSTALGNNCTNLACPACPTMSHTHVGDAVIGNPAFAFRLNNAPAQSTSFLLLNTGACSAGFLVPPYCGPIRVPLPAILIFGGFGTGGGVGCTGSNQLTTPIPMNSAFCGLSLSSQFIVICRQGPLLGTGVSNCLNFTITSS